MKGSGAGRKSTYTPEMVEKFFKRLRGCEGNISLACKSLGLSRCTPNDWSRNHPEFVQRLQEFKATLGRPTRW